MKLYSQPLKTILLALILSFGVSLVSAWTGPTAPFPANTTAPINTSINTQYKSGALGIGGVLEVYSGIIGLDNPGNTDSFSRWLGQLGTGGGVGSNSGFVGLEVQTIKDGASAGQPEQKLHLWTHRGGVLNSRALSIDGIGNVGIGTTVPSKKLDVNGSANISGDLINKGYNFVITPLITYGGYDVNGKCCGGGAGYSDTCNGDIFNAYTCSGTHKKCIDVVPVADYWSCGYCGKVIWNYRNIDCGTTASISAILQ